VSPRVPNQTGLPGRRLTPQNRSSASWRANASFTWSCGPTDTPPETTTTSDSSSAAPIEASVASGSSGTRSCLAMTAPARCTCPASAYAFEL
jgi:hypothetical protein